MKKKFPKKAIILGVIFLIIAVAIYLLSNRGKAPGIGPSITPFPSASEAPVVFKFVKAIPSGEVELSVASTAVSFQFNKNIDLSTVKVTIAPPTKYEISSYSADKMLYIRPVPSWNFNTKYTVTVNVKTPEGESLADPAVATFTPIELTESRLRY